ncbi:MAG TPA: hypothetical protein VFV66_08650 [Nonomuraea sp.]|nr:hypothetical protein [Nonomuraea sp.]
MTRMLRDTLENWAGEVRVPHDMADRALRRRVRWTPVMASALALGLVAALTLVVSDLGGPELTVRPASGVTLPARPSPAPTDVRADTENSPPARLVAAGRMAVSAYYTTHQEKIAEDRSQLRRTWSLYEPSTGGYESTSFAWVDVAPGLQVAAVVQGELMGRRLGIMDMNTREYLKWFDLEHSVASVAWSPDGTKILATAYSSYPDVLDGVSAPDGTSGHRVDQASPSRTSPRTGYYIVDVEAGTADFHPLPADDADNRFNARQDFGWSLDGSLIWAPLVVEPGKVFYTLDGRKHAAPEGERYVWGTGHSATSPDGRLLLGPDGMPTKITNVATGEVAGQQNVLRLQAWADDDNVLALGCAGQCENEYNNGLVLVSVDGRRLTQLTPYRNTQDDGTWHWVLTPR